MSRQAIRPELLDLRRAIGGRMRALRHQLYGGPPARPLGLKVLPARLGLRRLTYEKYEYGRACPGEVMLRLIVDTGVRPLWLLYGDGPMFDLRGPAYSMGHLLRQTDDE